MTIIRHLSVAVNSPEKCARVIAELTGGTPMAFKTRVVEMKAWICLWDAKKNELIELLPKGWIMHPTSEGASFKKVSKIDKCNSTHIQLEVSTPITRLQTIAEKYGCLHYYRKIPSLGGPLYEIWIEEDFLIEFVSDEI
ncbi:hypothetical protein [Legionella gresilensis]|uniref:hypothetical protein n=1 Tax=Legionella gresilensis TaxID=91823 RepID=UPI001041639C|nr:hypothetical protein [Legionella gresilensis]